MARKNKKPVDETPICDPAYARRIDPIWMNDRVPPRFWEDGASPRLSVMVGAAIRCAHHAGFLSIRPAGVLYEVSRQRAARVLGKVVPCRGARLLPHARLEAVALPFRGGRFLGLPRQSAELYRLAWRTPGIPLDGGLVRDFDLRFQAESWKGASRVLPRFASPCGDRHGPRPELVRVEVQPGSRWFLRSGQEPASLPALAGKRAGFCRPTDWYRIRTADFSRHYGRGLLGNGKSLYDLMREFLPQLDWDLIDRRRPIRIEEILDWANAHQAKHGVWPTAYSGAIPGSGRTWLAIDSALRRGCCGLPGGTSLSKLLAQKRGAPAGRRPPNLSEEQVLAWADAYFAVQGKWPGEDSGSIPGTRETWPGIASMLLGRAVAAFATVRHLPNSWPSGEEGETTSHCRRLRRSRFSLGPTRTSPRRENGPRAGPDRFRVRRRHG